MNTEYIYWLGHGASAQFAFSQTLLPLLAACTHSLTSLRLDLKDKYMFPYIEIYA